MPRYKLTLEYDGTSLVGWQRQKEGSSVQGILQEALYSFTGEVVTPMAAGRTDAGVHARGQVAHIDLVKTWDPERILRAANAHLRGKPVAVIQSREVPATFHARFSALSRSYEYLMIIRPAPLVLETHRAWWYHSPLDLDTMREAAALLLGTHDFSSFRASECQAKSPVKSLDVLDISTQDDRIIFCIKARSFLHHQVRNIVGSLKLVGTGKWSVVDFKRVLEARDRRQGGPTAPACGLTFISAAYPDNSEKPV